MQGLGLMTFAVGVALMLQGVYAQARPAASVPQKASAACVGPFKHTVKNIDGKDVSLCGYSGKVVLAVNTASFCGYTPQYEQLESLYKKYRSRGFVVLGFPANAFGKQEPGSNAEIKNFCQEKYSVSFPLFAKSHVNGAQANPFYRDLIQATGKEPLWNFHKYLIDRQGRVVSYGSSTKPLSKDFTAQIEKLL